MKAGRIRCGRCQRVLDNPDRARPIQGAEQQQLDAAAGIERGRLRHRFTTISQHPTYDNHAHFDARNGRWHYVCLCGVRYCVPSDDLATRRLDARDRSEDLYLGRTDTPCPCGTDTATPC